MILENTSGTLIGKIEAGSETWIHNAGFIWVAILVPLIIAAWFGMNNLRAEHVSPGIGASYIAFTPNFCDAVAWSDHGHFWSVAHVAHRGEWIRLRRE